jgi:glycosyltransferase involved in cell wall biosynthesis
LIGSYKGSNHTNGNGASHGPRVLMLLDNPCAPDVRVQRESAALRAAGASVQIVCWDRECTAPEEEQRDGIRIQRIRTPSTRQLGIRQIATLLRFYRRALELVSTEHYDVIHAHDFLMLPLGARLARRAGVPLIYDAHEIYHLMEAARYPRPVLGAIQMTERVLLRSSVDVFITVSAQRVTDYWRKVCNRREIFVVGNWYDPVALGTGTRCEARRALGVPDQALCVAYVGGLSRERRIDLLIEAATRCPSVFFIVAGKGDPRLEELIAGAAARLPNLRFLGWLEQPDRIYDAADALYYMLDPHHPYSPFAASNTLHVGISRQIPVITSAVGEQGQVMAQLEPRLALNPVTTDAIVGAIHLLGQPGEMCRIAAGMKMIQPRFTWQLSEDAILQAYARLGMLNGNGNGNGNGK